MYNKLFSRILDSSIWLEDDATRLVWLTLLAAMDEDGFAAFASVGNLAHRARVSVDAARVAVGRLEAPDEDSSDPAHEGRRLERVPGGWLVRNASKYRDIATRQHARDAVRARVRRHRDAAPDVAPRNADVTPCNGDVTPCNASAQDVTLCNASTPDVTVCNADVTLCNVSVTPSDTETEAETEAEAEAVAVVAVEASLRAAPPPPRAEVPARAGKPRPVPGYRRLRVFRWMLEDIIAALGTHAEAFDVDAFLLRLDRST